LLDVCEYVCLSPCFFGADSPHGWQESTEPLCAASANEVTVTSTIDRNGFQPWWNNTELEILGVPSNPKEVRVDTDIVSA
jgi:hypothetical protein